MKLKFDSNDIVVMQSIFFGQLLWRFGASLKRIIAFGDALDRTIHEYEDLKSAISKLSSSGLIKIKKDKVYITSEYRNRRKQAKAKYGDFEHETDLIRHVLKEFESKEIRLEDDNSSSFLTKTKWTVAYSNYKYDFQKQLNN